MATTSTSSTQHMDEDIYPYALTTIPNVRVTTERFANSIDLFVSNIPPSYKNEVLYLREWLNTYTSPKTFADIYKRYNNAKMDNIVDLVNILAVRLNMLIILGKRPVRFPHVGETAEEDDMENND